MARGGSLLGLYGSRTDNQWSAHGKGGRCPTGRDFFNTFLFSAPSGDPGPVRFSTSHLGMPRTGTSCWGDEGPATAYVGSAALTRGAWHQVELFVQANTPGQSNGVQRMWIDGVLRGEWRDLRFRDGPELMLNSVQLATLPAGDASYAQTAYIDDVVVTSGQPSIVASIDVAPASATMAIGTTRPLVATARDATGNPVSGMSFTWRSLNENVATVSADGVVGAVTAGTVTITASANGGSGAAAITVVQRTWVRARRARRGIRGGKLRDVG